MFMGPGWSRLFNPYPNPNLTELTHSSLFRLKTVLNKILKTLEYYIRLNLIVLALLSGTRVLKWSSFLVILKLFYPVVT